MVDPAPAIPAVDEPALARSMHPARVLVPVAIVAAVARYACLTSMVDALPHTLDTLEGFDAHTYRIWAERVAAGDWFSRGQGAFYYAPLYPTLLGWLVALLGTATVPTAIVFNAAMGVAGSVFCAAAAMRRFGARAGIVAGFMFALSGTQIAWESLVLGDALLASLTMAALWLMPDDRASWRRWMACGTVCAILTVGRASFLLPIALVACWLAWGGWSARANLRSVAAFVIPVCLAAGGLTVRNGVVAGVWAVTTNGPVNLYLGNMPGSPGIFYPTPEFESLQARINKLPVRERGAAWRREMFSMAAAEPASVALGLVRKSALFLSSWDAADNASYYFIRDYAPAMEGTMGPLVIAVIGYVSLALLWHERRRPVPVFLFAAGFAASIIVVFVAGRYKLPFTGFLCLMSGGGAAVLLNAAGPERKRLLRLAGVAAVVGSLVAWPRPQPAGEYADMLRPNEFFYASTALARANRFTDAARISADGADLFPEFVRLRENAARYFALGADWSNARRQAELARATGDSTPLLEAIATEAERQLAMPETD